MRWPSCAPSTSTLGEAPSPAGRCVPVEAGVAGNLASTGPLLVLHDTLQGVHEGNALAMMRTMHEYAR